MKVLLDTHFLLWVLLDVPRLREFPWLGDYRPWGISPISFLEIRFLSEVGRLDVDEARLVEAIGEDPRFMVDEVPLMNLVRYALPLSWTRDPFDRMLAAHSSARRLPLCSLDRRIRKDHPFVVRELRHR